MKHKVIAVTQYAPDAFELVCERLGVSFEPGNCMDILNPKTGIRKPYSIASSPIGPYSEYLKFYLRRFPHENGVSQYISTLKPGDEVELGAPFGFFSPGKIDEDKKYVYIATGTGISPFLSAMKTYKHKPYMVLYGVRNFQELVCAPSELDFGLYKVAISRQTSSMPRRISEYYPILPINQPDAYNYYICGLEEMISDCTQFLISHNIPWNRIFTEQFYC